MSNGLYEIVSGSEFVYQVRLKDFPTNYEIVSGQFILSQKEFYGPEKIVELDTSHSIREDEFYNLFFFVRSEHTSVFQPGTRVKSGVKVRLNNGLSTTLTKTIRHIEVIKGL
jgi:hypothetical protein